LLHLLHLKKNGLKNSLIKYPCCWRWY